MAYLIPLVIAILGLMASVVCYMVTFFGIDNEIISAVLLVGAALLFVPALILPIPFPWTRGRGYDLDPGGSARHNYWLPVPMFWKTVLEATVILSATGAFFRLVVGNNGLSSILAGISVCTFMQHMVIYAYHAPIKERENWFIFFPISKKHKHHHSKHDQK
jgi:hypothetical protein